MSNNFALLFVFYISDQQNEKKSKKGSMKHLKVIKNTKFGRYMVLTICLLAINDFKSVRFPRKEN